MWVVLGGIPTRGRYYVLKTNSSLFNHNGVRTTTALIKTEGLVTPLATIFKLIHHK